MLSDFPQDAVEEYKTVNGAEDEKDGTDKLHAVHTEKSRHALVEQIERPYEESQQRMAIDIIAGLPIRDDGIGDGIEA